MKNIIVFFIGLGISINSFGFDRKLCGLLTDVVYTQINLQGRRIKASHTAADALKEERIKWNKRDMAIESIKQAAQKEGWTKEIEGMLIVMANESLDKSDTPDKRIISSTCK